MTISLFMKQTGLVLLVALFSQRVWAVDPLVLEAQQRRVEIIEKVAPSVVAVFGAGGGGGGSGVVISSDGYALTNFHVTSGAGDFMKCGLNDGKVYDTVIVGIDPTGDVALIKLLGRDDFPVVNFGDSDELEVGDWAYAMGNPFLLATDFQPTVTFGIVSGVHRYQYPAGTFLEYTDCIQVDSSINPGNSGGPLFNAEGQLVGINGRGSFEKRGRVNSGAGYAISINQIKHFMGRLRSGRIVDHATLGATVSTESDGAVMVTDILEESHAYRRGLRVGDEIVSFAGRPIRSVNQFKNILGIYPQGWKLPLVYRHDNQKQELFVQLRALHRESEMTPQRGRRPKLPRPPDGRKPDDQEPGGKKPKQRPRLPDMFHPKPKPPEKYQHLLVKKEGYVNYYFNSLEQDRLFARLKSLGEYSSVAGTWRLFGKIGDDVPIEFMLRDDAVTLEAGNEIYLQQFANDLKDEPPGSGGLLVALHHLRRLLTQGVTPFTEVYYLGTEPLDGGNRMADVLVATESTAESRWYFAVEGGELLGLDLHLRDDVDACELRFEKFNEFDGKQFPTRVLVQNGDREFGRLVFEKIEFLAAPAAKNESANLRRLKRQ